jgi:peptide/nickel transport system permease protein
VRFLARRGIFYLVTAWAAVTINFLIPRLMPGNPVEAQLAHHQGQMTPQATKALEVAFGINLHESFLSQYFQYFGNVIHGNFGLSFTYFPTPVSTVIAHSLPWTVILVGLSVIIAWGIGTVIGIIAGWRRGGWWDATLPVGAFFSGIPTFWIGLIAVTVFGVSLGWFPVSGGYSTDVVPSWTWAFIGSALQHAVLPALTIISGSIAGNLLGMRNMMVSTITEDFVLVGEAKGLPARRIMFRYAARNAILPSVVGFALSLGFVVSGALLVEQVYSYPGIGYVLFQAVGAEDYPLMQAIFLIITLTVLLANVAADVVFVLVDPRTRQGALT